MTSMTCQLVMHRAGVYMSSSGVEHYLLVDAEQFKVTSRWFFRHNSASLQPGVIHLNITHTRAYLDAIHMYFSVLAVLRNLFGFNQKSNRTWVVLWVLFSGPRPATATVLRRCPWCCGAVLGADPAQLSIYSSCDLMGF